jgi:hypothetical protein
MFRLLLSTLRLLAFSARFKELALENLAVLRQNAIVMHSLQKQPSRDRSRGPLVWASLSDQ